MGVLKAEKCYLCFEHRRLERAHIIPAYHDYKWEHTSGYIDNFIYLCPSHHRYFDWNLLTDKEFSQVWPRIQGAWGHYYAYMLRFIAPLEEFNVDEKLLFLQTISLHLAKNKRDFYYAFVKKSMRPNRAKNSKNEALKIMSKNGIEIL